MQNSIVNEDDIIKLSKHQAISVSSRHFSKFLSYSRSKSVQECGSYLLFTRWQHMINKDQQLTSLSSANFCKHRLCVMCTWRKCVRTVAELMTKLKIISEQRDYSAIFVTLTVRNCELQDLRSTVKRMSKAWDKLIKFKEIKSMHFAFFRAIEFLGDHTKKGEAHPHYHVLMLVNKSYFKSREYLSQERFQELWRKALKSENDGIVNIKKVKSLSQSSLLSAVLETAKYTQKSSSLDAMTDEDLRIFIDQIRGLRQYGFGGLLNKIEVEDDDLSEYERTMIEQYIFNKKTLSYDMKFQKNISS